MHDALYFLTFLQEQAKFQVGAFSQCCPVASVAEITPMWSSRPYSSHDAALPVPGKTCTLQLLGSTLRGKGVHADLNEYTYSSPPPTVRV